MSKSQDYQVGDVVNGHRWNGETWTPTGSGGVVPPPPPGASSRSSFGRKVGMWALGATGIIVVVAGIATLGGDGDDSRTTAQVAPVSAEARVADAESSTEEPAQDAPKLGEVVNAGSLQFTVLELEEPGKIVGGKYTKERASGRWVAVKLRVENVGKNPEWLFEDRVKLIDDQDRQMSSNVMAAYAANPDGESWLDEINPGLKVERRMFFDVPDGVHVKQLLIMGDYFDSGVTIDLT